MADKWALFVDVALCHNCRNCFIACKDEHVDNEYPGYAAPQPRHGHEWISIRTVERGEAPIVDVAHLPVMCQHCEDAPCMKAAGDGAVTRREDGIVMIDPVKARGRRDIVDSCPYGAIWWNEALQIPQAWIFDAHLLDRGWQAPRCVEVCPTEALTSAKLSDAALDEKRRAEGWAPLNPTLETRPRVFYRNLHRYQLCFVAGTLIIERQGIEDCVEGAVVRLLKDGIEVGRVVSDAFGEFKIDQITPDSGPYELLIEGKGIRSLQRLIEFGRSQTLGMLALETMLEDRS